MVSILSMLMKKEFAKDLFRIAHNRHRNDKKTTVLDWKDDVRSTYLGLRVSFPSPVFWVGIVDE